MASTIMSLNFSRNPVLQGSMMDVVGFIFLIMFSISSLSSGRNASKFVQSLWYVFCVLLSENCSLIFLILLKKKSANLSGSTDGGSICGNGFASFGFVSDLRILYRFLALFSLSLNLFSVCVFLQ